MATPINLLMKININDKINQNNGVFFFEKKTKLESQIAELQLREQQITKQLKL
jgi:hypothetical protein